MPPRMQQYLNRITATVKELPSIHVTSFYHFRDILETGQLEGKPCKVFEAQQLLYLFYGKPAYSEREDAFTAIPGSPLYPTVTILKPGAAGPLVRVMPFDSGAFARGMFEDYFPHMSIQDFELDPCVESATRLVEAFFGSNDNYISGRPLSEISSLVASDIEANAYKQLISAGGHTRFDERSRAIEMQVSPCIDLRSNAVAAIILHESFKCDPTLRAKLTSVTPTIVYYKGMARLPPLAFQSTLYDIVNDFVREHEWL